MYCTNCGCIIKKPDSFCTTCGSPVNQTQTSHFVASGTADSSKSLLIRQSAAAKFFSDRSFSKIPSSQIPALGYCVIFTNLGLLQQELGSEYSFIERRLQRLLESHDQSITQYLLLDVSDTFISNSRPGDWESHVSTLKSAVDYSASRLSAVISSVFILGADTIIPMPCFGNLAGADEDVDTDHPYAALSTLDPWIELQPRKLAVGRLPVSGLAPDSTYLDNVLALRAKSLSEIKTFGISAEQWQHSSSQTYGSLDVAPLLISPPAITENVFSQDFRDSNLLFFNLHGSADPDEPQWFGESCNREFVPVITPAHLSGLSFSNIVGVEACYGAKYSGLSSSESTLISALQHKTVGFLGASRIAFGPPSGPPALADLIVGRFLRHVLDGCSIGQAHRLSATTLAEESADDVHVRLSVIEFNLFGDPTICLCSNVKKGEKTSLNAQEQIPTPAERLRAGMRSASADSRKKISARIEKVDLDALVRGSKAKALEKCRSNALSEMRRRYPNVLVSQMHESVVAINGKNFHLQNIVMRGGGATHGISISQDIDAAESPKIYLIK
jgi:hypothetical protein